MSQKLSLALMAVWTQLSDRNMGRLPKQANFTLSAAFCQSLHILGHPTGWRRSPRYPQKLY